MRRVRLRAGHPVRLVLLPIILSSVAVIAVLSGMLWRRRATGARQRALARVLDAADALETRLRAAREELEAVAGDDVDPVRDALQEMLRQRLWLREHGARASLAQLQSVLAAIDAGRQRIDQQLARIAHARAALS